MHLYRCMPECGRGENKKGLQNPQNHCKDSKSLHMLFHSFSRTHYYAKSYGKLFRKREFVTYNKTLQVVSTYTYKHIFGLK